MRQNFYFLSSCWIFCGINIIIWSKTNLTWQNFYFLSSWRLYGISLKTNLSWQNFYFFSSCLKCYGINLNISLETNLSQKLQLFSHLNLISLKLFNNHLILGQTMYMKIMIYQRMYSIIFDLCNIFNVISSHIEFC